MESSVNLGPTVPQGIPSDGVRSTQIDIHAGVQNEKVINPQIKVKIQCYIGWLGGCRKDFTIHIVQYFVD